MRFLKTMNRKHLRLLAALVVVVLVAGGTWAFGISDGDGHAAVAKKAIAVAALPPSTFTTQPPPPIATTTTTAPTSATTDATVPPTVPPLTITGTVDFLYDVSFSGAIDGDTWQPKANGTTCSGRDGYSDLAPGGSVITTDGAGVALATTKLGAGKIVNEVKNTQSERTKRETLIDAIYDLRVARTNDPVQKAQLRLDRANLRLSEAERPGQRPGPFEGHAFVASWCRLSFVSPPLPRTGSYQITVTHRGATTFTASQIAARGGKVSLVIGA